VNVAKKVRTIIAREEGLPVSPDEEFSEGGDVGSPGGGSGKRAIPKGHEFNPKALKPLSRALFSASVSLGHAIAAYKEFSRIKSSNISPDGMLGGRGYVLSVKDLRANLQEATELLSTVTDTLYDELNAPHWKPKLAELDENEQEDVEELVEEASDVLDDPETFGDEKVKEVESRNDETASQIPDGGGSNSGDDVENLGNSAAEGLVKQANSSLPVSTLPGPRVDHLDRGEQTGPGGSYNTDDPRVEDEWGLETDGGSYIEWGHYQASSAVPDGAFDGAKTDAKDFGIGWGAHGEGTDGAPVSSPGGNVSWGPSSKLPQDTSGSVARSDYYDGDKGNQFNVSLAESELPGDSPAYIHDRGTPNKGETFERQDVPYIKYDFTTHDYRTDQGDLYQYKVNGHG
jgi:hypothetical protein